MMSKNIDTIDGVDINIQYNEERMNKKNNKMGFREYDNWKYLSDYT